MTGAGLIDFLINLVALGGAAALFFACIDGISPNALFTKIAKIAVGVGFLIAFLLAVKAVLFGGGSAMSPLGLIYFAIGVIIVLVVLYLLKMILGWFLTGDMAWLNEPVMFVLGAVCLVALLYLAANVLFGVGPPLMEGLRTPRITR